MPVPDTLEVVVDRDAENLFGLFLAHYVSVQVEVDLPRRQGLGGFEFLGRGWSFFFRYLAQDANAIVADR